MNKDDLFKNMGKLGYPFFERENNVDANEVLAEVIKAKELRLLEGFPVLLANSMNKGLFNYKHVLQYLKNENDITYFHDFVVLSFALFKSKYIDIPGMDDLLYQSNNLNTELFNKLYKGLTTDKINEFNNLSIERVLNNFNNYYSQVTENDNDYFELRDKFNLEYSLSQIFAEKQKALFIKKLKGEKLTKTEKEYYSRVIKKKIMALADEKLHELAKKIIQR